MVFQIFLFQPLKARMGNLKTYQAALFGLAVSAALMPWVGYSDDPPPLGIGTGKRWLYAEIGTVLAFKSICAVGGLSSVLLLVSPPTPLTRWRFGSSDMSRPQITNCAPSHETLGTLNGVAQTLSAAGRSVGPLLSGGLFTLSTRLRPKGELLAWGLFGGAAFLGWLGSLAIHGDGLESADWVGDDASSDETDEDEDDTRGTEP